MANFMSLAFQHDLKNQTASPLPCLSHCTSSRPHSQGPDVQPRPPWAGTPPLLILSTPLRTLALGGFLGLIPSEGGPGGELVLA